MKRIRRCLRPAGSLLLGVVLVVETMGAGFANFKNAIPATAAASKLQSSGASYRSGEVLVKLRDTTEPFVIHFPADAPVAEIAAGYVNNPAVEYAEPNFIFQLSAFDPNDPHYVDQWYTRQVSMPLAWEITTGAPDVVVAVLDSGVDVNHPELKENIWTNPGEMAGDSQDNDRNGYPDDVHGWDFIENSPDPRPDATPPYSRTALHHGTLVAGIIAAQGNNRQGVAGIAWRTRIMPLRVLDGQGRGDVDQVSRAVEYATRNGADVINLSFVGEGFSQRLYEALRAAYRAGVVVVVAAGNVGETGSGGDLDKGFLYPVCYDAADATTQENWIIGVTATDTIDQRATFANVGSRCVDVSAPGVSFFGTQVYDPDRGLGEPYGGGWSGTSLAAPVVSGVAALIRASRPAFTPAEVTDAILHNVDPITGNDRGPTAGALGRGRVNAARALVALTTGSSSDGVLVPGRVLAVPGAGLAPTLKMFSASGDVKTTWSVFESLRRVGGSIAVGEDKRQLPANSKRSNVVIRGEQRIIVGEGIGGNGRVRIFDLNGRFVKEWYAFDRVFRGGVNVAAGDVTGSGDASIVVVAAGNGSPQVRIFDSSGRLVRQFYAYDRKLKGGFSVAVGDYDSDGVADIAVGSTTISLPVRLFRSDGTALAEWWPYPTFRGGVNLAAGDLDGDGRDELAVAPASAGGPQVRLFSGSGQLLGQFFVYDEHYRGGVRIAILR